MSERFRSDGLELAYEAHGDPAAPPVVLLHGLSDGRETWEDLPAALAARQRVFALDARGHGESERAPDRYRIEGYGGDVEVFLREVAGRPRRSWATLSAD